MSQTRTHTPALAIWPPQPANRSYFLFGEEKSISPEVVGRNLPAKKLVREFNEVKESRFHSQLLGSTRLFVNLPSAFFAAYLQVQCSNKPIALPTIMQDKSKPVLFYFKNHQAFSSQSGSLHLSKWQELGWISEVAYKEWLNTAMLFAFSHCMHYCITPRVFAAIEDKSGATEKRVHFKQVLADTKAEQKSVPILSVTGFEYRSYSGSIAETLEDVRTHSNITMQQILSATALTRTTDIVLIPYGMGVFIPRGDAGDTIKEATFAGMMEAFREYQGPCITIHCCGGADFFRRLNNCKQGRIIFEDKTGYDAYTIASSIEDQNATAAPGLKRKSMLINAADNDWTALLDPTKGPGQFSDGHTLYHSTSDEYYALVTCFSYFSIQHMIGHFKDQFVGKITQLCSSTKVREAVPFDNPALEIKSNPAREQGPIPLLQGKLRAYITRIESYVCPGSAEINFKQGFLFFKDSRALNRKANYMLAKELLTQLENQKNFFQVRRFFSATQLDQKRRQIIRNNRLNVDPKDGINSRELNAVIKSVR